MATELDTILFDLDGTICPQCGGDYENLQPFPEAVETINRLYDEGHKIVIYTARFMGRNKGDVLATYREGYEFTRNQLVSWGVKFHELRMGKPRSDKIVDDRAFGFEPDWRKIYEFCKTKSSE